MSNNSEGLKFPGFLEISGYKSKTPNDNKSLLEYSYEEFIDFLIESGEGVVAFKIEEETKTKKKTKK